MTEEQWVVAPKVAELEFERFTNMWRVDTDLEGLDEEDVKSFESTKRKIVNAICRGTLTVDETGEVLNYRIEFPAITGLESLKISPPTGAAIAKWDRFKERDQVKKIYASMGDICNCNPAIFNTMDMRDLKVLQAVSTLFLVS